MLFYKTIHGLTYLTIHGARTLGAVPESSVIRAWASFRPQYFCIMITVRAIFPLVDFAIVRRNLVEDDAVKPKTSTCTSLFLTVDEQCSAMKPPPFVFRGGYSWGGAIHGAALVAVTKSCVIRFGTSFWPLYFCSQISVELILPLVNFVVGQ